MGFSSHPVGFEVEVRSSEEGFKGAWFEATVVRSLAKYRRYTVAYAALVSDEVPTKPLEDTVFCTFVRPRPPPRSDPGARFELHQLVEAFHNDGWWKGVVSEVPEQKDGLYRVCFPVSREELDFKGEELREQLEWVKGKWVAVHNQKVEEEDLTFVVGSRIEVSRDKENYGAAWYVGNVLKVIGKDTILVEYDDVEVDTDSLKEIVDLQYIRPSPPPASKCDSIFDVLEEVEAFHKCGWVAGVVSELRGGLRYVVKFKHQEEEIEVDKTAIRPRFDWAKGQWVHISREKSGTRSHRRRRKSVAAKRSGCRVSAPSFSLNDGGVAVTSNVVSLKGMQSEHYIVDCGVEASQPSRMLKKDKFLEEHLKLVEGTLSVGRTSKRRSRSGKQSGLSIAGFNSRNNNVEVVECFTSLEDKVVEGTNSEERVNFSQPFKKLEKGKSLVEHLQVVDSTLMDGSFKTSQMGGKNSFIGLLSEGSPALVTGRQNSNRPSRQQVGKKSLLLSFPLSTEHCQEQGISRVNGADSINSVEGSSGYLNGPSEQQSMTVNFEHSLVGEEPANSIPLADYRDRKPARGSRGSTKRRIKKPIVLARRRKRKLCDVIDVVQHAQEELKERKRGRPPKKQVAHMNGIESEKLDGSSNILVGDKERREFVEPSTQSPTIDVPDSVKSVCLDKVNGGKTSVLTVNIERKTPINDVPNICLCNMQADIMDDYHEIPKIVSYIPVDRSLKYSTIQQLRVLEPSDHRVAGTDDEAQKQARPSMEDDIHIYDKLIQTETESDVEMGRSPIDHMPNGLALIKEYTVCDEDVLTESGSLREKATVGIEDMAPLDRIPSRSSLPREDYVLAHDGFTRDEPLLEKNVFAMERDPSDPSHRGSSPSEEDIRGHDELIQSALPLEKLIVEADEKDEIDSSPSISFCNKAALSFIKESPMWEVVESMEAFHRMPQQPHFLQLEQYEVEFREGMAIGLMVTFANLVDNIQKLQLTDSQDIFQEKMRALVPLELNGFKVHSVRSRLEKLLEIRIKASQYDGKKLSLREKLTERVDERDQFNAFVAAHDKIIMELEENLNRYREKRASMLSRRDNIDSEVVQLKMNLQSTEEVYNSAEEHFNAVVDALWEM